MCQKYLALNTNFDIKPLRQQFILICFNVFNGNPNKIDVYLNVFMEFQCHYIDNLKIVNKDSFKRFITQPYSVVLVILVS